VEADNRRGWRPGATRRRRPHVPAPLRRVDPTPREAVPAPLRRVDPTPREAEAAFVCAGVRVRARRMLPQAASLLLLHLLPGMELYLRPRAHSPLPSWYSSKCFLLFKVEGMARFRHEPPHLKFVSCRQGAFQERDTGDVSFI
jgi:hypothetical protein